MNIEIKKISPELINDYLDFFDNVAFTDNIDWAGCYCVYHHWNDVLEKERQDFVATGGIWNDFKRNLAIKLINNGTLQGYLAYVDDNVAGWCNANDKQNYEMIHEPDIMKNTRLQEKVKSIVCITIAPLLRRKGIATSLLNKVCKDAEIDGFSYVEGYLEEKVMNLYIKQGFTSKKFGNQLIVRKVF